MPAYPETNQLANALSPYLLQHRDNPVHWREWGPGVFAEAKEKNRPILLSVGYAACHWCHVMAHESFENDEIAALMNAHFVNVKVDREERPDIDQIYMSALQGMGEQGGWPMTLFLTPGGTPFWGGTYFPPESRYGRPGFAQVLEAIRQLYESDPDRVQTNAAAIDDHLARALRTGAPPQTPTSEETAAVAERLLGALDPVHGGIGRAPKFPSAPMWEALWRAAVRKRDERFREPALAWLTALCRGGIYDHVGGGLHRYTVDERWLVPHFEKMLYDNAQFVQALSGAYAQTRRPVFLRRLEDTIDFMMREMRAEDGAFVSSFDADSEGEEGRYYVWRKTEIEALLGDDATDFAALYDVTEAGNWEGTVILNQLNDGEDGSAEDPRMRACLRKLAEHRALRIPPARDDKVLADWNGLAVRALADAGARHGRSEWVSAAAAAFDAVIGAFAKDDRLVHARRGERRSESGLASDYAALINGAVSLFAATADDRFITTARDLAEALEAHHADGAGGYVLAATDQTDLPLAARHEQDDAIPSATGQIIEALARLSLVTDDPIHAERTETALAAAWGRVRANPFVAVSIVNAADTVMNGAKLVATSASAEFAEVAAAKPDPARIDLVFAPNGQHDASRQLAASGNEPETLERSAAYLCRGTTCLPPVETGEALAWLLDPSSD
ncbi:thioredoxin domain-containing protein [Pararhizobium mangrovi]|uniref:Thioredoxin domain-containing protein n=1 Tax=Pararhizobium mangrovi TaxID=2590452 RepID=A0A506U192_9HYPH|nr:thioredoxin domain-containing protein [Pararhizobium mangrovi]TPW27268.1 thioredoxin domain-containing protein [Pararhizobium mangrovi]